MQYSEEELKRWWAGLSKQAQLELLATMQDKMGPGSIGESFFRQNVMYNGMRQFTPKQLAVIRKWYHD